MKNPVPLPALSAFGRTVALSALGLTIGTIAMAQQTVTVDGGSSCAGFSVEIGTKSPSCTPCYVCVPLNTTTYQLTGSTVTYTVPSGQVLLSIKFIHNGNAFINWNCSIVPPFWNVNRPASCQYPYVGSNIQGGRQGTSPYNFEFKVTPYVHP